MNERKLSFKQFLIPLVSVVFTFGISFVLAFMSEYPIIKNYTLFQCLVWSAIITAAYTLSWLVFRIGKKKIPYLDTFTWLLSAFLCVLLVMKMTDSFEVALIAVYFLLAQIIVYIIKNIKQNISSKQKQ
ncbi:MAG TPA: hypothetical protein P5087_01915 [Eubacteriales bacterium]|mgnify:CR=1 FL=1|nr:hypothetical protein [Eubacteriales bacterium]